MRGATSSGPADSCTVSSMPSRPAMVAVGAVLAGAAAVWLLARPSGPRTIHAGFWFDAVVYESAGFERAITASEMATIDAVARAELRKAFAGVRMTLSDRRNATYRISVVPRLRDRRLVGDIDVAGESRAVSGLGGSGAVSFSFLASGAVACAPEDADRTAVIEAIGRGIGRTAVHELVHQLLPGTPVHDSRDVRSYEYYSAARCEQYFGEMRWDLAGPMLRARFGQ